MISSGVSYEKYGIGSSYPSGSVGMTGDGQKIIAVNSSNVWYSSNAGIDMENQTISGVTGYAGAIVTGKQRRD